jgi:hypothetical protein
MTMTDEEVQRARLANELLESQKGKKLSLTSSYGSCEIALIPYKGKSLMVFLSHDEHGVLWGGEVCMRH